VYVVADRVREGVQVVGVEEPLDVGLSDSVNFSKIVLFQPWWALKSARKYGQFV